MAVFGRTDDNGLFWGNRRAAKGPWFLLAGSKGNRLISELILRLDQPELSVLSSESNSTRSSSLLWSTSCAVFVVLMDVMFYRKTEDLVMGTKQMKSLLH